MIELDSVEHREDKTPTDLISSVPRIDEPISYEEFFREYIEGNKPCIFNQNFTSSWKARKEWVTCDGSPNVDFLEEKFGCADVPVADCDQKHYDSQQKQTLKLSDYLKYWRGDFSSLPHLKDKCLYLKDWHFVRAFPDYDAYRTPEYFASDWLNEFWEHRKDVQDDYRFVYIGPKGSWTPFHADVFRSFSWSANICGRKRWVFYPPGQDQYLRDPFGSLIYDIDSEELKDKTTYPKSMEAKGKLEVIQEVGEIIFVPSEWHHQVWNLESTISINHNWINGGNIHIVWRFLAESLDQVENAILDCMEMEDWKGQCQLLLKATHGMDFIEFYLFVRTIARRRLQHICDCKQVESVDGWCVGPTHAAYDLYQIKWCLEQLVEDKRYDSISSFEEMEDHPKHLLDDIIKVL
ncbi:jumonji domain containing 4 [Oratosquilla oratoria]|uniref:jumonji domain containing 4 n=1 Tax=Oratosquilla oratoria TaxID=337810 RepID=UPI003F7734B9